VTCREHDTVHRAAQLMWDGDCGLVPVVDADNHVIGVITDRDACMGAFTQGRPMHEIPVGSVMTRQVQICHPEEDISYALRRMSDWQVRRLPVVDNGLHLVGVISLRDAALGGAATQEIADTLKAVCRPGTHHAAAA
jgi:CBS domain-containing protein